MKWFAGCGGLSAPLFGAWVHVMNRSLRPPLQWFLFVPAGSLEATSWVSGLIGLLSEIEAPQPPQNGHVPPIYGPASVFPSFSGLGTKVAAKVGESMQPLAVDQAVAACDHKQPRCSIWVALVRRSGQNLVGRGPVSVVPHPLGGRGPPKIATHGPATPTTGTAPAPGMVGVMWGTQWTPGGVDGPPGLGFWLVLAFSPPRAKMGTAKSLQRGVDRTHSRAEISRIHLSRARMWAYPGAPYLVWSHGG